MNLSKHAKEVAHLTDEQDITKANLESATSFNNNEKNDGVSRNEILLLTVCELVKQHVAEWIKSSALIHKNALVSTQHPRIAPKSNKSVSSCQNRDITHGNLLKQSDFFPGFFLVYFLDIKKYFYCADNVLKLECAGKEPPKVARSNTVSSISKRVQLGSDNHDHHIMFHILNNKIFKNPGHKKNTVPEIV